MGRQIIKTSKNKYAIFSSISDDIIGYNATKEEVINFYREEAADRAEEDILRIFDKLENGVKPYHQFTMDKQEVLDTIKAVHGKKIYEERKKWLEQIDEEKSE